MKRREFLKLSAGAVAVYRGGEEPAAAFAGQFSEGRQVFPINRGWEYVPHAVSGMESGTSRERGWQAVSLPHSTKLLPWHDFDEREYEFVSTYRRRFRLPFSVGDKRVFVDFEGAMTASSVYLNGVRLGEYRGGYTPFSFELTEHLRTDGENLLTVVLDSTERADIPPFGNQVDYMTFGGIYREVSLRVVARTYIDNIHVRTLRVLSDHPGLEVDCFLAGDLSSLKNCFLEATLCDAEKPIALERLALPERLAVQAPAVSEAIAAPVHMSAEDVHDPTRLTVRFSNLDSVRLWQLNDPHLYTLRLVLRQRGAILDADSRRFGFREAAFTDRGFVLNGEVVKLRGLDRHQTFPWAGQAMPARVQRRDAEILRKELHCNIVRTSHYPQSRHFLDACDELGLMVLEEIPGWQHIGDEAWKQIAIDNVGRMIRRDWNRPAVILWGVRINESQDDHAFYTRTNAVAHALDTTRQTGGIHNRENSELLEDVFTINDFGFPLREPNHPLYLNTEFVGHTYQTRPWDNNERQREHTLRHARIHDQLASEARYAGGLGWCAFDYNTHLQFGSGDRVCYHGVADIFRELKPAGGFYKSQCEPSEEIVLEPAFHWCFGDEADHNSRMVVCSNLDRLQWLVRTEKDWKPVLSVLPAHDEFPHLKHPPFIAVLTGLHIEKGDLRLDGYLGDKCVVSRSFSGRGVTAALQMKADDAQLYADGADTTRVVIRAVDEYGARRPLANDVVSLELLGEGELLGESPLALAGGVAAVWVRAGTRPGELTLRMSHRRFGQQSIRIQLVPAAAEVL